MTTWQMYWLTRLDAINGLSVLFMILGAVGIMIGVAWLCDFPNGDESHPKAFRLIVPATVCFVFGLFWATLVPTTKEMAAILIVPKIVNNAKVQEIPNKLLDLATEWMDELKPRAEKK